MRFIEITKVFEDRTNTYIIKTEEIVLMSYEDSGYTEIHTSDSIYHGYSKRPEFNDLKAFMFQLMNKEIKNFHFMLYDVEAFLKI